MRYLHFIIIFFICLLLSAHAASPSGQYPALRDQIDHKLQSALEHALLKKFGAGFTDLVGAKKVGIVIADITDPHKPKVAAINGDVMMYAASLPKIAIVLGAFVQIERGEMALDNDTRSLLVGMVRNSSNQAATEILHRVGIANLAQIIQSDPYRLYDTRYNGGLWVGRDYGGGAVWKRDPLHNISHGATAMQAARFYYLAATKRLVKPEHQDQLREIFSEPRIQHKFVKGLKDKPDAKIYRKSGTWRNFHADSGVIVHAKSVYIITAMVEHPQGGQGLSELIVVVDDLLDSVYSRSL